MSTHQVASFRSLFLVLVCSAGAVPLSAETGDGLHGAYFDNQDLSGTPVLERTDAQIAFDWDGGSPDASVPVDGFSVRWEGWLVPDTTGSHTFHARTDDGVRLWVDGELLVDRWKRQSPTERSGTASLLAGRPVPIRMEYFESGGGAVAELRWTPPGGSKAFVPQAVLFTAPPSTLPPLAGGLQGAYFANADLYGDPVLERIDPRPQFDWGSGSPDPSIPADDFSVRWVGRITAPVAGTYRFHTRTDDGTNLWIDGELVVDDWNDHGPTTRTSREFTLAEGQVVQLVWEYYEHGGGALAELLWSYAGSPIHAVPTFALDPEIDPSIYLGSGTGLSARYFNNPHVDGDPDLERIDPAIDFDWGGSSPDPVIDADHFSVEWTGTIETQYSEDYTLEYTADDGVLVWVGGKLLIDEWHPDGGSTHSATFRGEAGKKLPIRVLHYERTGGAKARMYWSSANRPRQLVPQDRLYPTEAADPSLTIPASSQVSPAFVEGYVPTGRIDDLVITAGGEAVIAREITARSFFADLPLDATSPQDVSVSLPDGTPLTGSIEWIPTALDDGPAVVIRAGDSLLFAEDPGTRLTVLMASAPLGTEVVTGNGLKALTFDEGGNYLIRDQNGNQRQVVVVEAGPAIPLAGEIGFARTAGQPVAHGHEHLVFESSDPSALGVRHLNDTEIDEAGDLALEPRRHGLPFLLSRIGGTQGPIVESWEFHEFTVELIGSDGGLANADTGEFRFELVVTPFVPELWFDVRMFAGDGAFEDGSTAFTVRTSGESIDFPDRPAPVDGTFQKVADPVTGEEVAVFGYSVFMDSNRICHRVTPGQDDGTTEGGGWVKVGETDNVNPEPCKAKSFWSLMFAFEEKADEDDSPAPVVDQDACNPAGSSEIEGDWTGTTYHIYTTEDTIAACIYTARNDVDTETPSIQKLPKVCDKVCDLATTLTTSDCPGIHRDVLEPCKGKEVESNGYHLSRLDAHGHEESSSKVTTDPLPEEVYSLEKRAGTVHEPVIIVHGGGHDGMSFYGTQCPFTSHWVLQGKADGFDRFNIGIEDPRLWDLQAGWVLGDAMLIVDGEMVPPTPELLGETVHVAYGPGQHTPKFILRDPLTEEVFSKAEIHVLMVEAKESDDVGKPAEEDCHYGSSIDVSNYAGGVSVDSLLSTLSDQFDGPEDLRTRVSIDGYPQNEYWGGPEDFFDIPQARTIDHAEHAEVWLQGYQTGEIADTEATKRVVLNVHGQQMQEQCEPDECRNRFKGNWVSVRWEHTDSETYLVKPWPYELKIVSMPEYIYTDSTGWPPIEFIVEGTDKVEICDLKVDVFLEGEYATTLDLIDTFAKEDGTGQVGNGTTNRYTAWLNIVSLSIYQILGPQSHPQYPWKVTTEDVEFVLRADWKDVGSSSGQVFDEDCCHSDSFSTEEMPEEDRPKIFGDDRLEVFELGEDGRNFAQGGGQGNTHANNRWNLNETFKMHQFYTESQGERFYKHVTSISDPGSPSSGIPDYIIDSGNTRGFTDPNKLLAAGFTNINQAGHAAISSMHASTILDTEWAGHSAGIAIESTVGQIRHGTHFACSYGLKPVQVLGAHLAEGMDIDYDHGDIQTVMFGDAPNSPLATASVTVTTTSSKLLSGGITLVASAGLAAVGAVTGGVGWAVAGAVAGFAVGELVSAIGNLGQPTAGSAECVWYAISQRFKSSTGNANAASFVGGSINSKVGGPTATTPFQIIEQSPARVGDTWEYTVNVGSEAVAKPSAFGSSSTRASIILDFRHGLLMEDVIVNAGP